MEHLQADDVSRWGELLSLAFDLPRGDMPAVIERVGLENIRAWRHDGEVQAVLDVHRMGQWFGCRRVPMAGIAGVAVAPEARGQGLCTRLLRDVLVEIRERGFPISTLYPTTFRVYRKSGWEVAGTQYEAEVATADLIGLARGVRASALTDEGEVVVRRLYDQMASSRTGWLDRDDFMWRRVFAPRSGPVSGYLFGEPDDADGYVIFQRRGEVVTCMDVQARGAGIVSVLGFLADLRSTVDVVRFNPGGFDPLLAGVPDKAFSLVARRHWMTRIVDVAQALEMRGYPVGEAAELHLEIHDDDIFNDNNDRFILTVADGRGQVSRGGRGDVAISIRALAPLYTGFMTSWMLRDAGWLEAYPPALSRAAALFSTGGPPTILEMY